MSVEERREARRRRILENSENRLKKILGESTTAQEDTSPPASKKEEKVGQELSADSTTQSDDSDFKELNRRPVEVPNSRPAVSPPSPFRLDGAPFELLQSLGVAENTDDVSEGPEKQETRKRVKRRPRFDDVISFSLLGVVVWISHSLGYDSYLGENLMPPFAVVELSRYFLTQAFSREHLSDLGMFETVIRMSGISDNKALNVGRSIVYAYRVLKTIWVDMCFYLFAYFLLSAALGVV